MRLLDVTEVKLERLDLTSLTPHSWKPYVIVPEHIGVTSVLRHIALNLGTLKLHEEDIEDPEVRPWRLLMGMGWEAMGSQLYPEMIWQPKLLKCDGVVGHPDGYSYIDYEAFLRPPADPNNKLSGFHYSSAEALVIEEFKYTAKSVREKGAPADRLKDIRAEWMWMNQVKSYLAMARRTLPYFKVNPTAPLLARFHVLWAMGAYERYTLDERYLRYLIEFEQDEVETVWNMVVKNRDNARKELGHG